MGMAKLRVDAFRLSDADREKLHNYMKVCDAIAIALQNFNPVRVLDQMAEQGGQIARQAGLTEDELKQVAAALRRRKTRKARHWTLNADILLKVAKVAAAADIDRALTAVGLYWARTAFQAPKAPAEAVRPPEARAGTARTPAPPAGPGEAGKT